MCERIVAIKSCRESPNRQPAVCPQCYGDKWIENIHGGSYVCPECGGTGEQQMGMWSDEQLDAFETVMRTHILRDWPRERLVGFCKHLLGDICQQCTALEAEHPANAAQQLKAKIPLSIMERLEAVDIIIGGTSVPSREELDCAEEELRACIVAFTK